MSDGRTPRSASEWLIALRDAPDDQDLRQDHRRWLAADEGHRNDWGETLRTWQLMAMTLPAHIEDWGASAEARDTRLEKTPRPDGRAAAQRRRPEELRPPRSRLRRPALILGGLAASLLSVVLLLPDALVTLRADQRSGTGEVRSIELEDGSRLQLAPQSAVALTFDPSERRVELLRGEAFFEVVPETDRPFRVEAARTETVVLGTRFTVGLSERSATIGVEEGAVQVTTPADREGTAAGYSLSPGDVLEVAANGDRTTRQVAPSLVAAWRDGLLAAQHRPLGELVAVLDRYFDGIIIVADPQLAEAPMTGLYKLSDPEAALRAMAEAQGARVRKVSPWVLVLSRR